MGIQEGCPISKAFASEILKRCHQQVGDAPRDPTDLCLGQSRLQ